MYGLLNRKVIKNDSGLFFPCKQVNDLMNEKEKVIF